VSQSWNEKSLQLRIFTGSLLFLVVLASSASAQECLGTAREVPPQLSAETRTDFEARLALARTNFEKNPNADNYIWLGRRTAYLGRYKEAIGIYADAMKKFPSDARLFRHAGHRLITLRCLDDAIANLKTAVFWIGGSRDEIEPDGLPNARNIPTSTLQSNIWYHLGLAYYLKGDFRQALAAYREAEKVSKNPDMLVATTHWLYMTLRRLGRAGEARKSINGIGDNLDIIENGDYYKLIKLYQGKLKPVDLLNVTNEAVNTLNNATVGYGVGNWYLYNGQRAEAEKIFRQIVAGNQWASFGYIAAEAELTRKKTGRSNHQQ
jgi:tetratricopeptide (TPR) repeat protein